MELKKGLYLWWIQLYPMSTPFPGKLSLLPFLLFALLGYRPVLAQSPLKRPVVPGCGTVVQREGVYRASWVAFEKAVTQKRLQRATSRETSGNGVIYTIPVVFHVIHQNGAENVPEIAIKQTLNLLNDAFANRNGFNKPDGVDAEIRFCIAQQTPDGTVQTGLTRHASPLTDITLETDDAALKQVVQWDPRHFINIWIVRSITSAYDGPGVAGYANLPYSHGSATDGIVLEAAFMNADADNAKVLIHEMGHYLGLYHTFEGGCKNDDCTADGDRVCDTPPDGSVAAVPCATGANTCASDVNDHSANNPFRPVNRGGLGDQPDMIRNYMDYGQAQCQDKFTEGQQQRMRDALTTVRSSLLANTSICTECSTPITAAINVPDEIAAGVPVTFSLTVNDPAVFVTWVIDGQTYANQSTVTLTFPQNKQIMVAATITNSNPGCFAQVKKQVSVKCNAVAAFTATPDDLVGIAETISFTSNSGGSLTWKVDGAVAGTGPSFAYVVPDFKSRLITLTVNNGTCATESEPYYLRPDNCRENRANNVWYFGEFAGIDFNHRPAKAIYGQVKTGEGSATICDDNGQPLFHSDGVTVSNSNTGTVLQNGFGLTGDPTTTQSALFVPHPGDDRYLYLFTVAYQAGEFTPLNRGISYSVIDRNGDNGRGGVIEKNIEILSYSTEMLTAVKNKQGNGIWVIGHEYESNAYYSWLISDTGISQPVISRTGSRLYTAPGYYFHKVGPYAIGELKVSVSGKKLAMANSGWSFFEVSDFNNETGVISNTIKLQSQHTDNAYGVCFSPNERYVYGTTNLPASLLRFDLEAGSAAAVNSSVNVLFLDHGRSGGSIQLAPDGKIYAILNGLRYLSFIGNPNAENIADCGLVLNGIELLSGSNSQLGLPNLVQSVYSSVRPAILGPSKICRANADSLVKYVFTKKGRAAYHWIHKGVNQLEAFTDTSATLRVTADGKDTLILQRSAACIDLYDTLIVVSGSPVTTFIGNDTIACPGSGVLLDGGNGFSTYLWSNGQTSQVTSALSEGWVWVQVASEAGCRYRDSARITWRRLPQLNLGNDTSLCNAVNLTLRGPAGMDSYLWSDGSTGSTLAVTDSGTYRVTVLNNNCYYTDAIEIKRGIPLQVFKQDTLDLCFTGASSLKVPAGFTAYHWTLPNGQDTVAAELRVYKRGWHKLTYVNNCGNGEDSIYVDIPMIFPDDKYITCADTLLLKPLIDLMLMADIDGNFGHKEEPNGDIKVYRSGTYFAIGYDSKGCMGTQEVNISVRSSLVKPVMQLELGRDTALCGGMVLGLDAGAGFTSYQWSNGGREQTTTVYNAGMYRVAATYCGYTWEDSIRVHNSQTLTVGLGPDTALCEGQTIQLQAGGHYDWYTWSNGAHTPSISVDRIGKYAVVVGKGNCTATDTIEVTACKPPGGGIDSTCAVIFKLRPNPGSRHVELYSHCPPVTGKVLGLRLFSIDGKELMRLYGRMNDLNSALNRIMPSLASAVYIIEVHCPFCRDIKQSLPWQIMR